MGNYRDYVSKRECLIAALIWSVPPALQAIFFLIYGRTIQGSGAVLAALLLLLQLAAAAFHWYRYLAYDTKHPNDPTMK